MLGHEAEHPDGELVMMDARGWERLPSTIATTGDATAASMRRARSSEQLLQSSLFQRLVGADRDAIAPATIWCTVSR
jgi:hypothetical protein